MDRETFYRVLATYLDLDYIPRGDAHLIVEIWESNQDQRGFDFWSAISALDAIRFDSEEY